MILEISIRAGDCLAGLQLLGLKIPAVGSEDNRAFILAVARLASKAASVFVTSPAVAPAVSVKRGKVVQCRTHLVGQHPFCPGSGIRVATTRHRSERNIDPR